MSLGPYTYFIVTSYSVVAAFVLMLINKLCGLVLPGSTKFLLDDVIGKHNVALLTPLVAAVFGYGGISASAGAVLQILFWAFVVLAAVALLTGLTFKRPPSL